MELFKKHGEFRKYLEEKKENIKSDIKDYTLEIFNNYKKETLKKFLLDKYIVNNIPTIDIEKIK